ncbi:Inorganic pyrophosphatase [Saezia sanguinis]|uniref:Inorganic pyrophosphatase n=1 Tax=Saezia sanguinis TaxID=1965230 RepID=A0A433SHM7_9BURK|nr:inorganic diphosphatase [Saezia sanguinis]RUS68233.1 Inorganic pyrophosphatase [Saezia sanguinis]
MSLKDVPTGDKAPEAFNVVIEISANSDPVKYEVDKKTGALFVDRFMGTSMSYPLNYGYIPQTLGDDGDPLDVLVYTPFPLPPGVVVPCRVIGLLNMEDEAGVDTKLIALPTEKILPHFKHIQKLEDMSELLLQQVKHFFEHYKDLEPGKWVKVTGWEGADAAKKAINQAVQAAKK